MGEGGCVQVKAKDRDEWWWWSELLMTLWDHQHAKLGDNPAKRKLHSLWEIRLQSFAVRGCISAGQTNGTNKCSCQEQETFCG